LVLVIGSAEPFLVFTSPEGEILMDFFTLLLPVDQRDFCRRKIPREREKKAALDFFRKNAIFSFFY
jgi:hypothetical protein